MCTWKREGSRKKAATFNKNKKEIRILQGQNEKDDSD